MFYEGSNASAAGYGITYVRDRQMAAQPQAALQETEYKLQWADHSLHRLI